MQMKLIIALEFSNLKVNTVVLIGLLQKCRKVPEWRQQKSCYFKIEFRQDNNKKFTLAKLPIPSSNNVTRRILLFNSVKVEGFSLADIILQSGAFSTLNSSSDWLDVGRFQYVGDRYSSKRILKTTKSKS